ncbi:DMT family transporter [Cupriavidus basilensis]
MRRSDVLELLTLAALWGGSFLFMRVAAAVVQAGALIALRVAIASCFLVPILTLRGGTGALRTHWPHLLAVGVLNSAIPFCLFAYAELTLTAGFTSVLNAAAPLFAAIVAFTWLGERMSSLRVLGLAIGFIGVIVLVGGSSVIDAKQGGVAVAAALSATVLARRWPAATPSAS